MSDQSPQNPLGKITPAAQHYAPELLYPIPRQEGRLALPMASYPGASLGEDIWHLWELSWLDAQSVPQARVGRLHIPATSANLVESKSLKLYLNSLNMTQFGNTDELIATVCADIAAVVGTEVQLKLLGLDDPALAVQALPGENLDCLAPESIPASPDVSLLRAGGGAQEQVYHSHLLRSLCPVTAQPDWASVIVRLRGRALEPASLLAYLLGFRQHQEFHEQCVERIFCDLSAVCEPAQLSVQALYCRRGGLDINPWRCSEAAAAPLIRSARQ
ncbi:NADPH-dependent 7-cyano-7-deazaguanine reductase QueF [Halieaceae bacterium IMCC14734]|uniref:NADPH-dependent 7-cyano-7-deazaguanine reductase QueF n=1 Tax=Candidatus Litorirhabdus singularis TaxID=2518993 RepID=A0ABT3TI77_9GAMM|nr:NADPH-dependent 7-cyano-7-deazaguanine reductase QueF [Candidatus Litorirhabdus singularis]MCX2981451.1 NADPH-dependent 7-cyano-7-deazaguanine reductase QueF [Candidatus Litorirhabdus singularis]